MKYVALLPLLLVLYLPSTAHAEWKWAATIGQCEITHVNPEGQSCRTILASKSCSSRFAGAHYCAFSTKPNPNNSYGDDYLVKTAYRWDSTAPFDLPPGGEPIYNGVYTDEQCQAQYGTASVLITEGQEGPYDVGACSLTPAPGSVGFCKFYDDQGNPAPEGSCFLHGDFTATATGNTNAPGTDTGNPNPDTPDYLTETDDPASCPAGHVAYGGQAYCVDQSAIDDGSVSVPDPGDSGGDDGSSGGGIDWGEDSAGSPAPGTSTDSDGNPLGMGGGDPDGDGEGDSTAGDIVGAINSLKQTVRNGFDGLVDNLTQNQDDNIAQFADGAPTQADYDAEFGSQEHHTNEALGQLEAVEGELTGLIDGSDSEFQGWYDTLGGYFGSYFPTLPEPACAPLVFADGQPYSFTIDCEIFERIRAALAWILGLFTVWVVISTMFTARPS